MHHQYNSSTEDTVTVLLNLCTGRRCVPTHAHETVSFGCRALVARRCGNPNETWVSASVEEYAQNKYDVFVDPGYEPAAHSRKTETLLPQCLPNTWHTEGHALDLPLMH